MDKKTSGHSVGHLSGEYMCRVPHHVAPSLNQHSALPTDDADLLLNEFPYHLTPPTPFGPLQPASSLVLNGVDPVASLVRKKIKWELKKEKLLKSIRSDRRRKDTYQASDGSGKQGAGVAAVPRGVAMFARHIDADPDPAFNGVYNWYYTGGTMAALELNQRHYLLCSSSTQGEIKICEAESENSGSPATAVVSLDCNEPVYQIVTNLKGAAVRQQNRAHILAAAGRLEETRSPSVGLSRVCSMAAGERDGFVSIALPPYDRLDQFCTLGTKGVLRLWDTETCRKRAKVGSGEGERYAGDSWGSVVFLDDDTLMHADRCCVHIYDIRAGVKRQRSWCPGILSEPCRPLSLLIVGPSSHSYAATSHQLLLLDCRSGFVQCWTHMMAAPPYLGCVQLMEDNVELVCLGSESPGECVAVAEPWSLPRLLPSPATALLSQRRQGRCLHPALNARCGWSGSTSQTGLAAVPVPAPAANRVRVFRQSASGDVFAQDITRTQSPDIDWACGEITFQPQPAVINVTCVQDFRPLLTVLSGEDLLPSKATERSSTGSGWKVSKKYLEDCVDLMAESILKVWEIEEEDEWLEEGEEVDAIGEDDPGERVLNWLGATDAGADNVPVGENSETYLTTSQNVDTIKTEPEYDMTSAWDFPLAQQLKRMHPSDLPTPSEEGVMQIEKKSKTFDESCLFLTTTKPHTKDRQSLPSLKKKFVPGF